jgi:hypothetical protein
MDQKTKKSVGLMSALAVGVAAAGMAVLGNAGNPVDEIEDPTQEITFNKYKDVRGNDHSKVTIRLEHKGGISRLRAPGEREYTHEQNYFVRKLAVAFVGDKVSEIGSCVALSYHFAAGKGQKGLNLNDDVVQAYLTAVPLERRPVIAKQLQNAAARIDNNDPDMVGPISFMTNEVCGPAAVKAYPDVVKRAEQVNRAGKAPKP